MDFLKDYFEAWGSRVKSPIAGSIILSFVVYNWKAFFYLLFSEMDASVRIRFFDEQIQNWHSFVLPAIAGMVLAIALPWVNLYGSMMVLAPIRRSREIQINEAIRAKTVRLRAESELSEEQARRERAKIDYEKNLKLAEEVGGTSLKQEIIQDRKEAVQVLNASESQVLDSLNTLDDFGRSLVLEVGDSEVGLQRNHFEESKRIRDSMEREAPNYSQVRFNTKLDASMSHLFGQGVLVGGPPYLLTEFGYKVYDKLKWLAINED